MSKRFDSSIWILITMNLFPLLGVLFFGWSIFEIVVIYWLENVVVGLVNVLKMITSSANLADIQKTTGEQATPELHLKMGAHGSLINHGIKLFFVPFFCLHYGMFCFVHGIFIFTLLGGKSGVGFASFTTLISQAFATGGFWATLALVLSHLYSYAFNYLKKGEYLRTAVPTLMIAPYGRIVVLHLAILLGAFASVALGNPVFILVLLVVGKIALDIVLHIRSHRKLEALGTPH